MDAFTTELEYRFPFPVTHTRPTEEEATMGLVQARLTGISVPLAIIGWAFLNYSAQCRSPAVVALCQHYYAPFYHPVGSRGEEIPPKDKFGIYERPRTLSPPSLQYLYLYNIHCALQQEQILDGFLVTLVKPVGSLKVGSKWALVNKSTTTDRIIGGHACLCIKNSVLYRNTCPIGEYCLQRDQVTSDFAVTLPKSFEEVFNHLSQVPFPFSIPLWRKAIKLSKLPCGTMQRWFIPRDVFGIRTTVPVYLVGGRQRTFVAPYPMFTSECKVREYSERKEEAWYNFKDAGLLEQTAIIAQLDDLASSESRNRT